MDISAAAQPRSDQINADDLISGPQLVTIVEVRRGNDEQPVNIVTKEFGPGRPYKPGKSMIRVLIAAWGKDASAYAGRRLMIYRDPDIRFGKDTVGGIRISAMSHIKSKLTIALTVTRGRRAPFTVEPLADAAAWATIGDEKAAAYAQSIKSATTLGELKSIGEDLKTWDLGSHRDPLLTAWSARKAAIEGGAAQ